jgi:hypothetical protein
MASFLPLQQPLITVLTLYSRRTNFRQLLLDYIRIKIWFKQGNQPKNFFAQTCINNKFYYFAVKVAVRRQDEVV